MRNSFAIFIYLTCSLSGLLNAQFTLLKDIRPGNESSVPEWNASRIVSNGRMYFAADDGVHGTELWVSDGTENGTTLLKDIFSGPESSSPTFFHSLDSVIVFMAKSQNDTIIELWRTNGTAEGTMLVKEMGVSPDFPIYSDRYAASYGEVFQGELYFHANRHLWRTNGTAEGTVLINPLNYSLNPFEIVTFKGKVFFINTSSDWLFCTDGTEEGTVQIEMPLYAQSYALSPIGDLLYFVGHFFGIASDGREPWVTDGTREGTKDLRNINENICEIDCSSMTYGYDHKFLKTNQWVVFVADDDTGFKLWRTDGTEQGTTLLQEFGVYNSLSFIRSLYSYQDIVLFFVRDSSHGLEIWSTEGETWNTSLLKDINEGTGDGIVDNYITYTHRNKVYFKAREAATGISLWETDATAEGTKRVVGFYENGLTNPGNLISLGNTLILSAYTPQTGYEYYTYVPGPTVLSVSGEVRHPKCHDSEDGEIIVTAHGGEYPYAILWIDQDLTGFHVSGLGPGTYIYIVSDPSGDYVLQSYTLVAPAPIEATKRILPATQHFSNGVIELIPSGGASPYLFSWSHDSELSGSVATRLSPGTYTVTITDAHGCTQEVSATVKQISSPDDVPGPIQISVNPNPVTGDEIILRSLNDFNPGTSYVIYSSKGELVLRGIISNGNKSRIDVSDLLPGVYYLQLIGMGSDYFGQRWIKL